jgi:hypothetical protein
MRRPITIATCVAALLAAGLATADTVEDTVWIKGPNSRANYTEWRSIDSVLECSYGPWVMAVQSDGARLITRTKQCVGSETLNLGVLPQ